MLLALTNSIRVNSIEIKSYSLVVKFIVTYLYPFVTNHIYCHDLLMLIYYISSNSSMKSRVCVFRHKSFERLGVKLIYNLL